MRWFQIRCLVLIMAISIPEILVAAESVWFVQTLNDSKPWDKFVDPPVRLRIEGRMGSFGTTQAGGSFRLLKCDARFVVDRSKIRTITSKHTVEVKGYFKKNGSGLEFEVEDIKMIPGYAEQFDSRSTKLTGKLKQVTAEEWSELGDWVSRLGQFYDDAELTKKALIAYSKSIDTRYESLEPLDFEGRLVLAQKAEEYKLSNRRRMELIHEAYFVRWKSIQKSENSDTDVWRTFIENLATVFQGSGQRLNDIPNGLKESYEQDPVSTYRKSDDQVRLQLHRLFYVMVTREHLLSNVSADGRDGDVVADRIEQMIPEESAVAEKYRLLSMAYRLAHVESATRAETENLAAAYRARQQEDKAKLALLQWIKAHELRLKGDGAIGLVQLADEYLSLLSNEPIAVEYLTDAYKIDSSFEAVKTKLASLGYELQGSRWLKVDPNKKKSIELNVPPPAPTRIKVGMTATDLRTLLGQPGSLARAITSKGITEVWSFGAVGTSRLIVRLEKKATDPEPKVRAYSNPR